MFLDYKVFIDNKESDFLELQSLDFSYSLAVLQHFYNNQIEKVLEVNQESLELTLKTGKVHFFDKEKNTIQLEGLITGDFVHLKEVHFSNKNNHFVYKVDKTLPTNNGVNNTPDKQSLVLDVQKILDSNSFKHLNLTDSYKKFSELSQAIILENLIENTNPSIKKLRLRDFSKELFYYLIYLLSKERVDLDEVFKT